MSVQFPSLVEWIEEKGFETLHDLHDPKYSFQDFVNKMYLKERNEWNQDMSTIQTIQFEETDECFTNCHVRILQTIINKGIYRGDVRNCVGTLLRDSIPDYRIAADVVGSFFSDFLPNLVNHINKEIDNGQ